MSDIFGLPLRIVTDRGTAFTSKTFAEFGHENNVQHIQNAVRTPRANGQIERINQTINSFLRTTTNDSKRWDTRLNELQWAINSQINKTTGCCPNDIVFRFKARDTLQNQVMAVLSSTDETESSVPSPEVIASRIDQKKSQWKRRFDERHRSPKQYEVGDLVLVESVPASTGDSRKLEPKYKGPYIVDRVLNNDRYLVCDLDDIQRNQRRFESVFATDKMKPWCDLGPEQGEDDDVEDDADDGTDAE